MKDLFQGFVYSNCGHVNHTHDWIMLYKTTTYTGTLYRWEILCVKGYILDGFYAWGVIPTKGFIRRCYVHPLTPTLTCGRHWWESLETVAVGHRADWCCLSDRHFAGTRVSSSPGQWPVPTGTGTCSHCGPPWSRASLCRPGTSPCQSWAALGRGHQTWPHTSMDNFVKAVKQRFSVIQGSSVHILTKLNMSKGIVLHFVYSLVYLVYTRGILNLS